MKWRIALRSLLLISAALMMLVGSASAQVGPLIWEEDFDTLDNWIILTGNGSWGWGNGELEYYHENNVEIAEIPGEVGNNALHITAKQESGAGIVDQWGNPLSYTSGKVSSKSFVSVRYGMIEPACESPTSTWAVGPRCGCWACPTSRGPAAARST